MPPPPRNLPPPTHPNLVAIPSSKAHPYTEGAHHGRPSHSQRVEEEFDLDTTDAKLPGYTVDDLLAQNKIEDARTELERLCLEGLDSGISPEPPDLMMNRIREQVRTRAAAR